MKISSQIRQLVESNPMVLAGKPVIAGTRIPVSLVLNQLSHGYSVERILEAYPSLTKKAIYAAIDYAADLVEYEEVRS